MGGRRKYLRVSFNLVYYEIKVLDRNIFPAHFFAGNIAELLNPAYLKSPWLMGPDGPSLCYYSLRGFFMTSTRCDIMLNVFIIFSKALDKYHSLLLVQFSRILHSAGYFVKVLNIALELVIAYWIGIGVP